MSKQTDLPYTQSDFVRLALAEFPSLTEELEEADGLLHLQMHAFTRVMQRAKAAADWATYRRGVHLAAQLWSRPDTNLLNALNVSFLEHLDFEGLHGPEAWKCLTSELQHGWQAMKAYNDRVASLSAPPRKGKHRKHR
jgi:hypothetical protein